MNDPDEVKGLLSGVEKTSSSSFSNQKENKGDNKDQPIHDKKDRDVRKQSLERSSERDRSPLNKVPNALINHIATFIDPPASEYKLCFYDDDVFLGKKEPERNKFYARVTDGLLQYGVIDPFGIFTPGNIDRNQFVFHYRRENGEIFYLGLLSGRKYKDNPRNQINLALSELFNRNSLQKIFPEILEITSQRGHTAAPKRDLAALRTTSRHFYGKNPDNLKCLPNTRKYAFATGRSFLKVSEEFCRESKNTSDCSTCGGVASYIGLGVQICILGIICCVIGSPGSISGCICGCMLDTRNYYKSKMMPPRPELPADGFISYAPSRLEMS